MSALPPPPTDGDVNHGRDLNAVIWFFTAITTIVFACRLYARKCLTRNLGWDDAILGFSMALLYIQCAFVSVSVSYGLGRHAYYILISDPTDLSNVVKWQLFSEPIAIFNGTIPKIAVTMLLIKLLNPGRISVAYLWTLNIILNAISIVCVVTSFTQCTPTSTYWTKNPTGKCWNPQVVADLAITQGSMSAFVDFNLALFPITVILGLQMHLQKKIAVCFLMGLGSFAGVAAIVRTTQLAKLSAQSDFTWEIWTTVLFVAIECCIIIICACIPSLRPLFRKLVGESSTSTFPSLPSIFLRRRKGANSLGSGASGSLRSEKRSNASSEHSSQTELAVSGIKATTQWDIRRSPANDV